MREEFKNELLGGDGDSEAEDESSVELEEPEVSVE